VAAYGDAIVVGSAIVNRIAELGDTPALVPTVAGWVRTLAQAIRE